MDKAPNCYLNTRQAAALLGVSRRTLESYRVKGGGPPFLSYFNRIRYLRGDLERWAEAERKRSTSDDGGPGADSLGQAAPEAETSENTLPDGSGAGDRLNPAELAALLEVSERTLARYRSRGMGPAFERVDGQVFYPRANVEAWLAGRRGPPAPASESARSEDYPAAPEEGE